ncbi:MAG: hypothetical protein H6709_06800 [Kofleriaceae bacterium]|nr:hypothetical protein [Kofleriaceae bacterium]
MTQPPAWMQWARRGLVVAAALVAACGPSGGGGDDASPDAGGNDGTTPIPGGGAVMAPVAGAVKVFVVEAGSATPIAGATVRVGAADAATPLTATTDGAGLAAFADDGLAGPQTITAVAAGHTAVTWIGVAGSAVTIPLDRQPAATPSAHATGTIAGWDALPTPSFGHYTLAVVLYTFTDDVAAPENHLAQATSNGAPLDTCVRTASEACAWQLVTRVGPQRHVAVIVDGDAHLTPDDTSDDTYTLIGYAIGPSVTMTAGQQLTGETLTMIGGTLTPLTVSFPAAPAGLGEVVAIPMLDLGADGRVVFPLPTVTPGHTGTQVLPPTGDYAGTYHLVTLANPAGAAAPYSSSFADDVAVGGTVAAPAWLAPPSGLTGAGRAGSFTSPTGASVAYATLRRGDGTVVWSVALLDGASAFTLPTLAPDPLGSAGLTMAVTAADLAGFDPGDFRVLDLTTTRRRASGAERSFQP